MRPNLFLGCLWAWCSCAIACAQTPEQRPSGMRDSGVVTRAAPTLMAPNLPHAANAAQNGAPQRAATTPANFPTAPGSEVTSASLGDQAWTNTPARSRTAGQSNAAPMPTTHPSQVVPAQFTQVTGNQVTGTQVPSSSAARTAAANPASGHEPRPLKPPSSADAKAGSKGSTGTVQMFISVISSLAIVIGLILASAWFYRKAAPTISGALPKQVVQVLGRTPLAPRQQLILLRLGSKLVLVSNLHGEVRTISEITDPLEVDRLAGLCEASQPGSISESFRSVLHNIGRNG